jgi:hypothetical protein
MTSKKPKSIVTLGFGDGQAFFTLCQAARGRLLDRLDATELVHHESASRGFDDSTPKQVRFLAEMDYMNAKWATCCCAIRFTIRTSLGENLFTLAFPSRTIKPWQSVVA